MPPSKQQKEQQAATAKKIEDKTFGMKNKNKSKQVQKQIAQMKQASGVGNDRSNDDIKKDAAKAAINDVLFKEALTKKDIAKRAMEKLAAKEKKEAKAKEPDKRDIYTDTRDQKKIEGMEDWDEATLREAVNKKAGGQGERCQTDIICKHFLEAVEKRTYGWFWECPNGGDKCQYRHALPEGYVLKRDKVDEGPIDLGPSVEDIIEEQRKNLGPERTPVTFERLQEWLAKKKALIAAAEEEKMEAARKQYAKGKAAGVTGRMLFDIDSSLFVDDAGGMAEAYKREESDDEDDAGGGGGGGGGGGSSGAAAGAAGAAAAGVAAIDLNASKCCACGASAASASGGAYAQNYAADGSAGPSSGAAAVDVTDLAGVDESLFMDDDLPDDEDLDDL